jgi:hypothetical protein
MQSPGKENCSKLCQHLTIICVFKSFCKAQEGWPLLSLSLSLIFVSSMQLCPWCNYALLLSFVMWTHANLCECDYARFIELDLIRIFTSINYTFIVSSFMLDKIWMYWIECIITKHSNHLSSVPDGLNNMHVDRLSIILYNSFFPFLYQ